MTHFITFNGNEHHPNWSRTANRAFWAENDRKTLASIEKARTETQRRRAAAILERNEIDRAAKAAKHATVRLLGVRSAKAVA